MQYFLINDIDCSMYVSKLSIDKDHNYKSMVTASGKTLVKYINSKRVINVELIPLNDTVMQNLLSSLKLTVTISYRNPETNELEENVSCIIPSNSVEYYTIQENNVSYKALSLKIQEL